MFSFVQGGSSQFLQRRQVVKHLHCGDSRLTSGRPRTGLHGYSDAPAGNPLVGPVAAGGVGNPLVVDVTASMTIGPTVDELGA